MSKFCLLNHILPPLHRKLFPEGRNENGDTTELVLIVSFRVVFGWSKGEIFASVVVVFEAFRVPQEPDLPELMK